MSLARTASVIGWGESYATEAAPRTPLELAAGAIRPALDRANVGKHEIEGLLTGRAPFADQRPQYNNVLSSHLNLTPRLSTAVTFHGAGVVSLFKYAAMAVATGVADPVLCVQSDAAPLYTDPGQQVDEMDVDPVFEFPYGATMPSIFALIARRQMAEFDVTREQFAEVAVTAREWGSHHPHAAYGDAGDLTVGDVLDAPMVADPLGLYDCTPWGPAGTGGAFVVTAADNAPDDGTTVDICGVGECSTHEYLTARPSVQTAPVDRPGALTSTGAQASGRRAFRMAGLDRNDIDVAEVAYLFSNIAVLLLEDLGFCEKGRGGEFVANGGIDPESGLAFGTHGGDLTFGQPGISFEMNTAIECIRQVTGNALGKQVVADTGLVHGIGSTCACHSTAILQQRGAT
jgi:acetyl-CoA acetyltransferase